MMNRDILPQGVRVLPQEQVATEIAWTSEKVYFSGDAYYQDVLTAIRSAKKSVLFEVYIFDLDDIGEKFLSAFLEARKNGVEVRIIIDGVGSPHHLGPFAEELISVGIQVRIFNPIPRLIHFFNPVRQRFRTAVSALLWINKRDHRKLVILDESVAFCGSMNISHLHSESMRPETHWHDFTARVEGGEISELAKSFELTFKRARDASNPYSYQLPSFATLRSMQSKSTRALVRLNDNIRQRLANHRRLLLSFQKAEQRIWITNAYFVPDGALIRNLTKAAQRGVDVRILLPAKSDVFFMYWVGTSFYGRLLRAGVRIFEYQPRVLHAKSIILDQTIMIGSSNLNRRSLMHDLEADLFLSHSSTLEQMREQFIRDLTQSHEVNFAEWRLRPFFIRWLSKVFLLIKYWI